MSGMLVKYGVMIAVLFAVLHTPYALSYPSYFGNRINTPADNPLTVEGVALGRRLFYERRLSANNTISCGTCHIQSRAFTDGRRFSLGYDGTPTRRNSMSLANVLWTRHFFWDGRAASLEAQAVTPLTDAHEMGQPLDSSVRKLTGAPGYSAMFAAAFGSAEITPERIVRAIGQFERTLISADAPYDRYLNGEGSLSPGERRGYELFFGSGTASVEVGSGNPASTGRVRSAGCGNCHGGPRIVAETYHNNGLDSEPTDSGRQGVTGMGYDRGRFRVVSLRNIALTAPYMHDGRFGTLTEVIDHYSEHVAASPTLSPSLQDAGREPIRLQLSGEEKADLIAFLNTLTDSTFITDPRFADPKTDK